MFMAASDVPRLIGEADVDVGVGRWCNGCSWCVAVVGEDSSEWTEKYVEVGVLVVGGVGGTLVCTEGRTGDEGDCKG